MHRTGLLLASLFLLLLTGCAPRLPAASREAVQPREVAVAAQGEEAPPPNGACSLTVPTTSPPTDTDVFGDSPGAEWYCSEDNELCAVKSGPWQAGGMKVGWRKPLGTLLEVTGRRLDADAPPLGASVPGGYLEHFQASGLIFPTEGCWEVEARAEESVARFVVEIAPAAHPPRGGSCNSLSTVVRDSDGIITGTVHKSTPGPDGRYIWHTIGNISNVKHPYARSDYTSLEILQDTREAPALEQGHTYLLFLQRDPFQLFCPARTVTELSGQQLTLLQDGSEPLWEGALWSDVREELMAEIAARD